jgi:peptidoglycan lytic transglycosylase
VVVNDRGPYSGGRDLDLSQGAAEHLGLTTAGVDYVDYEVAGSGDYAAETYEESAPAETEYAETKYAEADYAEADYDDGSGGEAASGGSYVVQSGDTLTGIAAELGTGVDDLMAANGLTDPDYVYAGQTLVY